MTDTTISSSSESSLAKQLFNMTWPMVFGVLSMMSFQLVDSAFIGQLGVLPLAAQGFTLPIQLVIIGIQVGLGIATTAIISRALGAKRDTEAKQLGGLIILMGGLGIGLMGLALYALRHPILWLLGAPQDLYPVIDSFWVYWLISAWTGAMLYFFYSVCRANGNTMLPGTMMVVTSLLNLALDPLFIFTFDLGLDGAAMATTVSFFLGLLIVARKVLKQQWVSFQFEGMAVPSALRNIMNIMGPAMISQLLPPVSSMLATKLLASFGTAAVAAWALASRFEFFAIVSVLALTMSMPPMIGRLLGEKNHKDIYRLVSIAIKFILVFQTLIAVITWIFSAQLASLMTSDESVAQTLSWHLALVPFSLAPLGICMLLVSVSNALGKAYSALTISALRLFVFFLPCLWVGAYLADLQGLFVGVFVGNVLAGLSAWIMYKRTMKKICEMENCPS